MPWESLATFTLGREWVFSEETTAFSFRLSSLPENTPFQWGGLIALGQMGQGFSNPVLADVRRIFRRETAEVITLTPPTGWDSWRLAVRLLYPLAVQPPWLLSVDRNVPQTKAETFTPGSNLQLLVNRPRIGGTISFIGAAEGSVLYLDFVQGAGADQFALTIPNNGYYELPFSYDGAMWGSFTSGTVLVREIV